MTRLFKVLLITVTAVLQLPVLGMQTFAKRAAAQILSQKMNHLSASKTYKRDQYNNRQKYDQTKKESSRFNYDWKKLSYQSPFKNWSSIGALAAAGTFATSDNQSDSDTDQLQKENLLSLLHDVCDDNYSILQDRAKRLIQNNPEWVAKQLELIFNDKDQANKLSSIVSNNALPLDLLSPIIENHLSVLKQQKFFHTFFIDIMDGMPIIKSATEKLLLKNLFFILTNMTSDLNTSFAISELLPHKHYGPAIIEALAKTRDLTSINSDILHTAFYHHTKEAIEHFCIKNKCKLSSEAENSIVKHLGDVDQRIDEADKNFSDLLQSSLGNKILIQLGSLDLSIALPLHKKIAEHVNQILEYCDDTNQKVKFLYSLKKLFSEDEKYKKEFRDTLLRLLAGNQNDTSGSSATLEYIVAQPDSTYFKKLFNFEPIRPLITEIILKEQELDKKGYYTFVHGQRWSYQLPEEWFTKLWALINNKQVDDFIFAHVKPLPTDQESEKETRERILLEGRKSALFTIDPDRARMLFMNAGFFYNESQLFSNTAHYVTHNANANRHIFIALQTVFKYLDMDHVFHKYKKELNALEERHNKLSSFGNTLLIAVPKEKINDVAFVAAPGGYKKTVSIEGMGQTSDMHLIMDTLQTNPLKVANFDQNEFCLLMTADKHGGLNPESGIKFFQVNTVNPERWQEFKEKEQALFTKIAQDIKKEQRENKIHLNLETILKHFNETMQHN